MAEGEKISPSELGKRVAILRRFKELLKAQRDRFEAYLNALDRQRDVIERGTTDDLLRHVELEEKIVTDIFSIQKVIDPLEKMYQDTRTAFPAKAKAAMVKDSGDDEIISLKEALNSLKTEAAIRSGQNRELLAKRMADLRSEIKSLRSSAYTNRRANASLEPSLVDLKG